MPGGNHFPPRDTPKSPMEAATMPPISIQTALSVGEPVKNRETSELNDLLTITVDINVVLDVFQKREPHDAASAQVVGLVESGTIRGIFPAHGLTTLYYLVRKHAAKPDAEAAMDFLSQLARSLRPGNEPH